MTLKLRFFKLLSESGPASPPTHTLKSLLSSSAFLLLQFSHQTLASLYFHLHLTETSVRLTQLSLYNSYFFFSQRLLPLRVDGARHWGWRWPNPHFLPLVGQEYMVGGGAENCGPLPSPFPSLSECWDVSGDLHSCQDRIGATQTWLGAIWDRFTWMNPGGIPVYPGGPSALHHFTCWLCRFQVLAESLNSDHHLGKWSLLHLTGSCCSSLPTTLWQEEFCSVYTLWLFHFQSVQHWYMLSPFIYTSRKVKVGEIYRLKSLCYEETLQFSVKRKINVLLMVPLKIK